MSLLIKALVISSPSGVVGPSTPELDGGRDDDWELEPEPVASSPWPGCQLGGFGGCKVRKKKQAQRWEIDRVNCSCYLAKHEETIEILS